ncbi:MAG TPA: PAS domain S-box protein [Methanospirillum sp.]|nr:PAS domain S-box protein [Methanospirillum sp.]
MDNDGPIIVAIDDYKDNLVAVKAFVTDAFPGAKVYTAENGRDGIDLAREKRPDVILLDIVMPGMDGFEVCQILKNDPDLHVIPVIFLTALKGDRESRIRALDVGGDAFISKPFEEAEFKAQIRAMVKIKAANVREQAEKESLETLVAQRTDQLEKELALRRRTEEELNQSRAELQKKNFELQSAYEQISASEEELRANLDALTHQESILRINEERLLMAQKISKSGSWEYNLENGTIWGSSEALSIYGFPPVAGVFPIGRIEACVEDQELVHQAFVDFLSGKQKYNLDITINPADGSPQKIVHSIANLEKDNEGNILRVVGVIQDVTEQKRTEEVLRETNEAFIQAQKIAHVGSWTYNLKTNTITWSDELFSIFGYEPGAFDLTVDNIRLLFHPDDLEKHDRILAAAIETHIYEPEEYRVIYPDGSIHYLTANGVVELDENGAALILIGVCQEITERILMERALIEKTDELEKFFTVNLDLLSIADSAGYFTRLNLAFETTLGFSMDELMAEPFLSFVHPDDKASTLSAFADLHDQKEVINFTNRYRCKDGSYRWLEWCSCPYGDFVYAAARDVTGKINDEKALKAVNQDLIIEKEKAQKYFDIAGSLLLTLDPDGLITLINQKGSEILGLQKDQIIGKNWFSTFIPERLKDSVQSVFTELIAGNIEPVEYYENPIVRADGEERILAWHNSILTNEQGKITGILSAADDITERIKAEQDRERLIAELGASNEELRATYEELLSTEGDLKSKFIDLISSEENLRQTKEYLENLISIANVPIIIWNQSSHITRINRAFEKLTGRSAEEIIGNPLQTLFPADETDRVRRLIQATYEGVRWDTTEIGITHLDGTLHTLLWNSATLYSSDGITPIATIAQGQDITEQRRLEKEKERAIAQIQKNLAQLAILNDGIRNPLTILAIAAEMAQDIQVADTINNQITQIDEMINQVDRRWIESEKILEYLRKHYQVDITRSSDQDIQKDIEQEQPGKKSPLIEEIQAELFTILDSIDALIYVADMETYDLLYMNRHGRSLFGDIGGKKCYKTIQKDMDGPCPFCTNPLLIGNLGPVGVYQWEYQNTLNGRWYDCRDRAIRWTDGRIVRLQIATDITERKHTADRLSITEGRLQTLVKTIPDLIWLKDKDGIYLSCNTMFERLYGASERDIVGKTDYDFVDREKADSFRRYDQRAIDLGRPSVNEEWVTFAENGHEILLETIKTPMVDAEGTLIGVLGIGRDITGRFQMEQALRESNELLTQFIRHSPIYAYIKNVTPSESRVLEVSDNYIEMIGIPGRDMIGKTMAELFPDEFAAKITADDWAVVVNGAVLKLTEELNDRSYISIKFPIVQGGKTQLAGYTIDVTDLKQTQTALHEANHKLRLLTGLTRHDIFNQLSTVDLFLNLAMQTSDPAKINDYISRARQVGELIEKTIGFTREYEDFGTASSGWHRIFPMIESAINQVSPGVITIENQIPEDLEIYTDPIIRKVFTTLIENAIRHGKKVKRICFSFTAQQDTCIIACEDDGIGIYNGEKSLIFEHGYGKHTGIGLFLAREILSITGLGIRECGIAGEGARFEIMVPKGKYRIHIDSSE